MILPYTIVNALTQVRVSRRMPRQGEVVVGVGESVEASQLVAQTTLPGDFRIVDVTRALEVSPKKARQYIKVKIGQRVREGDVLAVRGGLSSRRVRAPIDGQITGYGRGRILLEAPPRRYQLSALVPGSVVDVWPGNGVMIETTGAYIQCSWGNDRESYGVLQMAVRTARRTLRAKQIDASSQGTVVVGGSQLDEEALDRAIEMRVRGIIVGGIPPALIPRVKEVDFPVIATEGVGTLPMSKAVFELLRSLDRREAAVSGRLKLCWGSERPYIVVPMPTESGSIIQPDAPLVVGSRIRGLRLPYLGVSGTVMELPPSHLILETGARLHGAQVKFDNKDVAFVPYLDLERLL